MTLHFSFDGIKPGIFIILDRKFLLIKERKMATKKPIAVVIGRMNEQINFFVIFDEFLS